MPSATGDSFNGRRSGVAERQLNASAKAALSPLSLSWARTPMGARPQAQEPNWERTCRQSFRLGANGNYIVSACDRQA